MATQVSTTEEIARRIARFAAGRPSVLAAYLFGSALQQRLAVDSDIDVGLLFADPPDLFGVFDLQDELTRILGRQTDLVCLNRASPILAMQVLKRGAIVFQRSERAVREFQVRTHFAYVDLKQVRKPIEEALLSG